MTYWNTPTGMSARHGTNNMYIMNDQAANKGKSKARTFWNDGASTIQRVAHAGVMFAEGETAHDHRAGDAGNAGIKEG